MKQKLILTLVVVLSLTLTASSQLYHSLGAGLVTGNGKLPAGAEEGAERPSIAGYGIFYYPRYNISETESGAISVGIPLTAGLSGSVNSREGGTISIIFDFPLTVDYNLE